MSDWLSPQEVAQQLRVSVATLKRWRLRSEGPPCVQLGGRVTRYSTAALAAYMERSAQGAPAATRSVTKTPAVVEGGTHRAANSDDECSSEDGHFFDHGVCLACGSVDAAATKQS